MTQASYAILEGRYASQQADTFAVHLIRVPYDIERAIQHAEEEHMPELDAYAEELRTAQYRGTSAAKQAS
jgi:protein phosphatase